jgi:hypothetical protein
LNQIISFFEEANGDEPAILDSNKRKYCRNYWSVLISDVDILPYHGRSISMSLNGYDFTHNWLYILIFIHVVSAIVGIGPTFFIHVLLRKGQTYGQLRNSLGLTQALEKFPKILGSLAVVSGLLLAWLGDYSYKQFWIYGSIALYVLI